MSGQDSGGGNSTSGAASPFPPGVVPNYVDPADHREQTAVLQSVCLTLITLAISGRLYTRAFIVRAVGVDDYMALAGWALTVAWSGILIAGQNYGVGRHVWDIPPDSLVLASEYLFVEEIMYAPIVLCIKLSFFLFFLRVFGVNRKMKWFIWFGIASNFVFYVVVFFDTLFLCKPIQASWDPTVPGTCGSEEALPYASGIFGFLSDFYILLLPMPCLWKLNMQRGRRLRLMAVFGVGLFACVASIVRFVFTLQLVNDEDPTWNYSALSLWAVLEIDVALICLCALTLPAMFEKYKESRIKTYFTHLFTFASSSEASKSNSYDLATSEGRGRHVKILDDETLAQRFQRPTNGHEGNVHSSASTDWGSTDQEAAHLFHGRNGIAVTNSVAVNASKPIRQ